MKRKSRYQGTKMTPHSFYFYTLQDISLPTKRIALDVSSISFGDCKVYYLCIYICGNEIKTIWSMVPFNERAVIEAEKRLAADLDNRRFDHSRVKKFK